jgi:hypothetical protein
LEPTGFGREGTRRSLTFVSLIRTPNPTAQVFLNQEKAKKRKYLEPCLARRRHFTPLVFSVDGLRDPEAVAAQKQLANLLAIKWGRAYSQCCAFVLSRISVAIARGLVM